MKNAIRFKRVVLSCTIVFLFLSLSHSHCHAITKAELFFELFTELGYTAKEENPSLPIDVPPTHRYAREIGTSVRYGLIPESVFLPDDPINRRDAVLLSLKMMGWGFETSLYQTLSSLPELAGSGDPVFFFAAEMIPPAPKDILLDGPTPLSNSGRDALISWVRACRESVRWNRVVSHRGTDLILYRQGVARPGEAGTPRQDNPVGAPACEPLYIAAVAVQPKLIDQRIAFAGKLGQIKASLTEFVESYEAIAAVNGGFFAGGRPLGTMLLDGVFAGKPLPGRSAVGWNNQSGKHSFGSGSARIGVRTASGYVELTRFNVAPDMDEASLYIPGIARNAIGTAGDALELSVRDGVIVERREATEGIHEVPEDGMLIVARGLSRNLLEELQPGSTVNVVSQWDDRSFLDCTDVIQAGPMLLLNDQFTKSPETFKADVLDKRHPRTIMGSDGERVFWAVVDGRSPIHSRGATISETRWIAKALGLKNAINMDGGGSSQLIWRGILINSPSDGKERPLPYAVLMLPKGAELVRRDVETGLVYPLDGEGLERDVKPSLQDDSGVTLEPQGQSDSPKTEGSPR